MCFAPSHEIFPANDQKIDNGILKVLKVELGGLREQLFFLSFFFRKVGVGRCVFFESGLGLIRDGVRVLAMSN